MQVTTIGLDLAKNVFQIHGIDAAGEVVIRKRVRRPDVLRFFADLPPCTVGMEACSTAHYWARELMALGHQVRLVPPAYVKPYVKRGKNDAIDAEAICEAVTRPNMRFVPVKGVEQQAVLVLHRTREVLVRQRTMLVNALRAHMAEFGIVVAQGIKRVPELVATLRDKATPIPEIARATLDAVVLQLGSLETSIRQIERRIVAWCRANDASAACDDSGRRPDYSFGDGSLGDRSEPLPLGPALRRLARPRTATELDRRQDAYGQDIQNGRRISPQAARCRYDGGDPVGSAHERARLRLDQCSAHAPASAPRQRRTRQQDGADRVGDSDARRDLPRSDSGCRGLMNES